MVIRRKRGCHSGASPRLVGCSFLDKILGCRGIPKLRLFYPLFLHPSYDNPKLENFNHRKLNKTFMRSVSKQKQITTISTVPNQFIFCFCIISTVFQLFYGKNSSKKTIEPSKQAHNARKTESVKTEQVCSNPNILKTSGTPKILKK